MYAVEVMDLIRKVTFTKHFSSPYLARNFVKKLKYSKKLRVISTSGFF